ncbi:MAG: sugar-binding transcriptional regulator [Spartobacteria bacterium]
MKRIGKKSSRLSVESTLVQVARLYYENNLSQQEIADMLGVSRPLINLYIKNAHEEGIVRVQIIDPTSSCIQLGDTLKNLFGIKNVTVVPNPRGAQTLSLRAVAGAAAEHISTHLTDGATFGLCWGRTTAAVVELLKPTRARNVDAVPLLGDSGHSVIHSQMNQLVMQAAQHLGVKAYFLSLPMVVSSPELRDALLKEEGIRDILKKWDHLTLACMGIGTVPPTPGMVVYMGEEILPKLMLAGAVGDLCGIYFDRHGRIIPSGLEDRKIAVAVDQLRVAKSIVAFACGDDRALAVLGAMRTGLVSSLFIDQSLAERILDEISAEKSSAAA